MTMVERLVHRGPDGVGVFAEGPAALACRRLAIVDVAGGAQPLFSEDGRRVLVCNGEIFNHEALRGEAERAGHRFATGSDVEVLLHLHEERGEGMLDALEGQFAFALYDRERRSLLLARDAFGVAPLFWARVPGGIVFASEIKALLAHPMLQPRVDLTGVDQVFAFPGLVSPRTAFEGVHSLPPGHLLVVDEGGVRERAWWDLDYPEQGEPQPQRPAAEWAEALAEALAAAVRCRLQGEVPVGAYLSGGLDSSLLVALLAEIAPASARDCFSVVFDGGAVDERLYQRRVAEATGRRLHAVAHEPGEVPGRFARMLRHAECPVKESYNTCAMALAEAASAAGVRVVLSGEGADELFAGYPGYRVDAIRSEAQGGEPDALIEADLRRQLWGDPGLHYERRLGASRALRMMLYAEPLREGFERVDCLEAPLVDHARIRGRHPLHQRSYLDMKLRLGDHLVGDHGDRMAMAASVEARFPFLDRRVVELARRMPPEVKLGKAVLKQAARGRVPGEIVAREKMGFHAPGTPWLLRHARQWVLDSLSPARIARQGVFDPDAVASLTAAYAAPGFRLTLPFDDDLLMVVLSYSVLADEMGLSAP